MSSKRASVLNPSTISAPVRPPCKIDPKAIISEKAVLVGTHNITIGANTVIHPYSKLDSTHGSIEIGQYCIVSERATVGFQTGNDAATGTIVEDHVTIETGSIIESSTVGKASTIGAFAMLKQGSIVGKFCTIKPTCTIDNGQNIPDWTVMLDANQSRIDQTCSKRPDIQQLKLKGQTMHVDALRKLIPSNVAKWQ